MLKRLKRFSRERRALFIFCCILLLMLLIIGTTPAIYAARVYYIKTIGLELKPSRDFEVKSIRYYLQNDAEWGGDSIGLSNRKMSGTGCLITCVASAITDLGVPVTPGEVNLKLTEVDGYQGAELIWYKINEAYPEIDYKYTRIFSSATIESDLQSGLLPIVNVRMNGIGATHWLLIIGAKNGEFIAYDPLNPAKEPINLSKHGNVHSYRVLVHANVSEQAREMPPIDNPAEQSRNFTAIDRLPDELSFLTVRRLPIFAKCPRTGRRV